MNKGVRLNISEQSLKVLENLAKDMNVSINEALRKALSLEIFLVKEWKNGSEVFIQDKTNKMFKLTLK